MGGLPTHLTSLEVKSLLESFGKLKSFNLVIDTNKNSKG